jgi:3-polyprenyl-4-hydroxybenzoate decarboxylase
VAEERFPDLRSFLDRLRRDGDLATIDVEVDPRLEAAEIHRRVIAAGGPALLFRQVRGSDFPLVTNLFGTARRAGLAFGERPRRLVARAVELARTALPPTLGGLWNARDARCPASGSAGSPRVPSPGSSPMTCASTASRP